MNGRQRNGSSRYERSVHDPLAAVPPCELLRLAAVNVSLHPSDACKQLRRMAAALLS